ncbi:hypothetical protein AGMMS50229_04080 [Campylobacterota bacterium]|nr:hypothetical protein AGMMS50229_04080 [Campylobacterota bacterium]
MLSKAKQQRAAHPATISGLSDGSTISAPATPIWTDNNFPGWYNGATQWVFGAGGTTVTSNITLTAKWQYTAKQVLDYQDFGDYNTPHRIHHHHPSSLS